MSRFSRSGWRLTATVLAALVGAAVFPPSVGAAPKTNSLSGQAQTGTFRFNGTIVSDDDGSPVRGTFILTTPLGTVNVDANCLAVQGPVPGGRVAGASGVVHVSKDPSFPVGSGVGVQAFDSDNPAVADGLSFLAVPGAPGDCEVPADRPTSVTDGKITIRA
jgi:hypothetical protein